MADEKRRSIESLFVATLRSYQSSVTGIYNLKSHTANKMEIVPSARPPNGAPMSRTVSTITENSFMKLRAVTAELCRLLAHIPHPFSWLLINESWAAVV